LAKRSDERARGFLPVAPQDLQMLLALRDRALHGYGMMKAVEEESGGALRVELGSLYRMIYRLEREGLIEETAAADDGPSPGRDRRFYRTTSLGNAVIGAELERLRSILERAGGLRAREARS
jgi:DNA-binding PadR family transcriptional regulator